jgi:hypothetical protein
VRRFGAVLLAVTPAPASACAVCGANGGGAANFLSSTLFLSLLPLVMIGAGLLWLRFRARATARPTPEPREHAATPAGGRGVAAPALALRPPGPAGV